MRRALRLRASLVMVALLGLCLAMAWRAAAEEPMPRASLNGHVGPVISLAFTTDGKLLASGGGLPEGEVKVWDVRTGRERGRFQGHPKQVDSVAFSPDDKTLASASEDGTVVLWD